MDGVSTTKFARFFVCKKCNEHGEIEPISKGFSVVSCRTCGTAELWGEDYTLRTLEHFLFQDLRVADA